MTYNQAREDAVATLYELLGITNPSAQQDRLACALLDHISRYIRSQIGH